MPRLVLGDLSKSRYLFLTDDGQQFVGLLIYELYHKPKINIFLYTPVEDLNIVLMNNEIYIPLDISINKITHWMPLPEPPEDE